ncbi:MAG: PAC2 family protein [Propionibacteriaceae bacterium]
MDPRLLYTFNPDVWEQLKGTKPVLIHLLDGFVDAGGVSAGLRQFLVDAGSPQVLADFDIDQLHDYRSRRPVMTFDTNSWVGLNEYHLTMDVLTDANGQYFLLFHGPEPDAQWHRTVKAVLGLAERLEVSRLITVTGIPMAVPHTRPTLVTTHATDPELARGNPAWVDRVQVPASLSAMLEYTAGESDHLGQGFVAHVPHYLAQTQFPQAILAVLGKITDATGLRFDTAELERQARQRTEAITAEIDADGDFPEVLHTLEGQYDDMASRGLASIPTADELGAAVERFLREQGDEGP